MDSIYITKAEALANDQLIIANAKSGIKGNATQSNAPTPYDAVTYPNGLFETYVVREPLTMPNNWGSAVTQAELDGNTVYFDVKNGVITKVLSAKTKADPAKIVTWTATTFAKGSQVLKDGKLWESNSAIVATDVPGVSSKWVNKINSFTEESFDAEAQKYRTIGPLTLFSTAVRNYPFSQFINYGNRSSIFNFKLLQNRKISLLKVFVETAGELNFVANRDGVDISISANVDVLAGWNEIAINFNGLKDDYLGYSRVGSTTRIGFYDGSPGSYYSYGVQGLVENIGCLSIEWFIGIEGGGERYIRSFEDVVTDSIGGDVQNIKSALDYFLDDYIKTKVELTNDLLGYVEKDGTILAEDENHYAIITNIGIANKLIYKGARPVSVSPSNYVGVLFELGDGSKTVGLYGFDAVLPQSIFEAVIDIPASTVKIYISWSNYQSFAYSIPDVYLFSGTKTLEEDSVKKYIDSKTSLKTIGANTHIFLEKPKNFVPIVNLIGDLPTDISDERAKTNMKLEIYNGSALLFKCDVEAKIQGSSSVAAYKKNYSIKFKNDAGKTLKLKIGDWSLDSSFHFKGYGTSDGLLISRDISGGRLLKDIFDSRPFPKCLVSDYPRSLSPDENTSNFGEDANMVLQGFPIQLNWNNSYRGLYIWRQRRENGVFRMNDSLKTNIYLANNNSVSVPLSSDFDYSQWELKSPKISGYSESGPITDVNVLASINAFFNWCKGIDNGSINFEATAPSMINIDNWVDVIVFNQILQNWDYYENNMNLMFWGTKWSLGVTDLDWTVGLWAGYGGGDAINLLSWRGTLFPNKIYPALLSRIKIRYTELRNNKIIDINNLYEIYSEIPSLIGENRYKKEVEYWTSFPNSGQNRFNTEKIMTILTARIGYLDSIWKLP